MTGYKNCPGLRAENRKGLFAMKISLRLLALVLALMMTLSAAVFAEAAPEETANENPVLATMDGQEIRLDEVQTMLERLLDGGYITDEKDYKTALDYLIQTQLLRDKITEMGFDQFTPEEEEAFAADAATEWAEAIANYVQYFSGPDSDPDELKQQAEDYYTSYGMSQETLLSQLKSEAAQNRLEEYLFSGKDVAATEEEVRAVFQEYAQQDLDNFDGNVAMYELYENYYGQKFWFTPEGYRGILHILIGVDEEVLSAYSAAQAAYEESKTDEAPDGDEALKAAMEEARQAVIASKQDVVDEIYARLEKGEAFTDLIREYNEDPGMQDAANLQSGYKVHKDSAIYDPAFTAGAFSERMAKVGDVSDPVVGSNGIHILYYLQDVPAGIIEMTDEIFAEIESYIVNTKKNTIFIDAMAQWQEEHEIVYNQEAIDALTYPAPEATPEGEAQPEATDDPAQAEETAGAEE